MNETIQKYLDEVSITRPVTEVIVHCTATPAGRDVPLATIRKWHVVDRGWSDIGYHFVVALDGTVQLGRPVNTVGSHVAGHNTGTIGISYVGGTDDKGNALDTRTPAQKASIEWLLKALMKRLPSIKKISGHRDYAAKACPSFDATKEYAPLLKGLPAVAADPKLPARTPVGGYGYTTATKLNVREKAVDGKVLGILDNGTRVAIFGRVDDWYRIEANNLAGWVSAPFVTKES